MSKKNYPIRIPRHAAGIRAQELHTGPSNCWWERRFFASVESKDMGGRFGRGRNYALSGQVTALTIEGPHVTARVMGLRTTAYDVTIDFRAPAGAARRRIIAALRREPMLVARLLDRDLPIQIEGIFKKEQFDLFPGGRLNDAAEKEPVYDMTTRCTCPDYANPCKHAYAVLMILGEEIVRRPMTLLELRGIREEDLYEV